MPLQTFLRPRKVPRNLSPQGAPRPTEHPSSSHLIGVVQLATTSSATPETQPSALEKGIGAQVMALVGKDELAEVHTTGHLEEVSTESYETISMPEDHALEPVAQLIEEDFPHILNSQPYFAISPDPPSIALSRLHELAQLFRRMWWESTTITVDHMMVTSGVFSTIPTDGSAPTEPVFMLTSGAPALVIDDIPSEFQLEVGESSSFVPAEITMNSLAEDGRSLAMVPHEEAPLPSLVQPFGDIFDFLD